MDIYKGMIVYDNHKSIQFGNLQKQQNDIRLKFERKAWPGSKKSIEPDDHLIYGQKGLQYYFGSNNNSQASERKFALKTNASRASPLESDRSKRPISARVNNIVRLTEDYHLKGHNMNMSLAELKEVVEAKKKLHWKLKREMDNCSEHFKGNSNALKSISNFSESAFQNRHQSEQIYKKLGKLDDENQQLVMKKDRLQGLIKEEKFMLGQLKDESLVNHKTANALKKYRDGRKEELRNFANKQNAMKMRLDRANMYERKIYMQADVKKNANLKLNNYIM